MSSRHVFCFKICRNLPISSIASAHCGPALQAAQRYPVAAGWRKRLRRIKRTVSLTLDIDAEQLNEISLEDIEIEQASQQQIYQALCDMALRHDREGHLAHPEERPTGVPCTGFWVEETRELILFAWNQDKTKTIVVPPDEWFLRDDITVH